MIDCGASDIFINKRFVHLNKILTHKLDKPRPVYNIDGSLNKAGSITHGVWLTMSIGSYTEKLRFYITDLGPEDIILGGPWFDRVDPIIHWKERSIEIPDGPEDISDDSDPLKKLPANRQNRRRWVKAGILEHATDELWCHAGFTINASTTKSTELAAKDHESRPAQTFEELVPEAYHEFAKVFSDEEAQRLPQHQNWDHTIDLKPDAPDSMRSKIFPMPLNEQEALDSFLKEHLEKGYIIPSKSPMASPFFFVKKKDGKLRPVMDYRKLNDVTIKNVYPLPLASDIINRLRGAKVFTKFDVRWGYNNIRIKEGDEYKAAFVTNRGLFEPRVMYFGLTNSPATFQTLMNVIFADLIAEGKVAVYLDDILIWSDDLSEHRKVVKEVLSRLQKYDLYLRPEKCLFERDEIEFLGLIIRAGEVAMDPIKTDAIASWPIPQNLKDVRGFIGFANFYRRFIKDFSKMARPLHDLTKKDVPFVWGPAQQQAFDKLKDAFITQPVLAMWDPESPTRIEVDASGFATGGVIEQKKDDGLWHPIAYRSASMTPAERNYEIYDREMLGVCEALKDWRYYLEGLPEPFEIATDHQNLVYWRTAQHLTRRQARWALLLGEFHFVMVHKPGLSNHADPLTRQSRHEVTDADDNQDVVMLKPEHFLAIAATAFAEAEPLALEQRIRDCSARETEVAQALAVVRKKGPRRLVNDVLEWEELEGLLYYKGKLYIPHDKDLRAEIIKSCHDTPSTGHPGKHGTLELVSRYYWWPRMAADVEKYVLGCDACQRYKPASHPRAVLQPQEVPTRPWENIGVDLITQLPASRGWDSIAVYVDHFSDQTHLSPCKSTITAEGVADLHYKDVFRLHGMPKKVYSDRGPQFAARFMRGLYQRLGITTGFTTAYHPQGNGKVERKNQEVEQYLRIFCNQRQDDWVDHLPAAEFALNSRIHSGSSNTPFELIYGYRPDFTLPVGQRTNIPALERRLDNLADARKDAEAALRLTKTQMKERYEHGKKSIHTFKVGDQVWLNSKEIKIHQPSPKLGPRQLGPFKVLERIGDLNYRLELPDWLKIHPVFHVDRLSPWRDNGLRKPPPPKPDIIDGEEEYEVEKILDSRVYRRQLQYLVQWKGFGPGDNSWQPAKHLEHTPRLIAKYHKENPSAPRAIKAATFEELAAHLRNLENLTDPTTAPQYEEIADYDWENGKYLGINVSRGRSVIGGG